MPTVPTDLTATSGLPATVVASGQPGATTGHPGHSQLVHRALQAITAGWAPLLTSTSFDVGTGTERSFYAADAAAPALLGKFRHGTTAAPITTVGPTFKVSRTEQLTRAQIEAVSGTGADGVDLCSALVGLNTGAASTEVQAVGVFGAAKNSSTYAAGSGNDACGVYGAGRITAGDGVGIGAFFIGRRDVSTAFTCGLEVHSYNGSTAGTYTPTAFNSTNGIWLNAGGTASSAAGMVLGNAFGRQFDVGLAFNGQVTGGLTGGVVTTSIRDDSTSLTSVLVEGTHATASIAVATGAGTVTLGRTNGPVIAGSLMELYKTGATVPMLVLAGNTGSDRVQLQVGNGSGNGRLFAAHASAAELAGTVAGDLGFSFTTTKTFHLGRVATTGLRISDNFGIFGGSYGGGVGVVSIADAGTVPSTNPTGGVVIYAEGGATKIRGSAGTVTTIAPA